MNRSGLDTRSTATGISARAEAAVEGNSRLTAMTGIVLIVLLAAEGVTLLDVRGLITMHIVLGALLVGPVVLKIGSTGYRFARYYTGAPAYVRKGPPHPVLRVLGPGVIVTSLAVIGTGIALGTSPDSGNWGFLHRASFIIWLVLMTIHVLGHLVEVVRHGSADLRRRSAGLVVPGRPARLALVALALVVGVGTAALVLPASTAWTHSNGRYFSGEGGESK